MDMNQVYTIILGMYGLFESVLLIFGILGFISWRIWAVPMAWILNKIMRKQYGVIEIQSKGNKILCSVADLTKDYYEKYDRLFNLAAAKEQNLVFTKYGVPHIHFDEHDTQPKPFHPQRETEAEKARNSASQSNLMANQGTFYKRFAMALQDKRLRTMLLLVGAAMFFVIVNIILTYMVSKQVEGLGNAYVGLANRFPATTIMPINGS